MRRLKLVKTQLLVPQTSEALPAGCKTKVSRLLDFPTQLLQARARVGECPRQTAGKNPAALLAADCLHMPPCLSLVPLDTVMLIPPATMVHAARAMAASEGRSCCGRGAPRGIKASRRHWAALTLSFYPPPPRSAPAPPQELHPK